MSESTEAPNTTGVAPTAAEGTPESTEGAGNSSAVVETPPATTATTSTPPADQTYSEAEPDYSANVYNELARTQHRLAQMDQRVREFEEREARTTLERQDADLTSRRDTLRQQMLSALDAGDEKSRTMLSWQLSDVDAQLASRQQSRALDQFRQPQQRQAGNDVTPQAVWQAFSAANGITPEEHQRMWGKLQERLARGDKVQENPVTYAQLLRDVRRPATRAVSAMPKPAAAPMIEGTGNSATSTKVQSSRYSKADLDQAANWFDGKISAETLAKMTGG